MRSIEKRVKWGKRHDERKETKHTHTQQQQQGDRKKKLKKVNIRDSLLYEEIQELQNSSYAY